MKIRTVFVDATAFKHLPVQSCVVSVNIPLDYHDDGREGRLMRLLIDEIHEADVLPLHLPSPGEPRIKQICDGLLATPADSSTVEQWARQLDVTSRTIHRLSVRETGMTFAQWRDQARLLFALQRLAQGERIIDVSFDCGYASQSAFTAMFRRHFGKPPSAFYR